MNKQPPKISVVIPSLNQGKYIQETIESVFLQNYPNVEVIVCDGGSTDGTVLILQSYDSKINWTSEPDKGQSDAINKGLKRATGDILVYINSDDVFCPNAFWSVSTAFQQHPTALWITGDYEIIDEHGKKMHQHIMLYKRLLRTFISYPLLAVANMIAQPSTYISKKAYLEVGEFKTNLHYCMDYDYWLRLMLKKRPIVLSSILSKFRVHNQSKGANYRKQFEEEHLVLKQYTTNPFFIFLHRLHARLVISAYSIIKQ